MQPDPDDWQTESSGYDSDDYDDLEIEERRDRSQAASTPSPFSTTTTATTATRPGEALGHGVNLLLLFGAAVDRFMSSLKGAILAAGRASISLVNNSSAGCRVQLWKEGLQDLAKDLPDDAWGKILWIWDRPQVQKIRLTISMANLSIRLPALLALIATQVGLLASQVSLPMLAPLLLGTGMALRSIKSNASMLFPRLGLLVVLLWMLWFVNSVIQNTVAYLRRQGALDQRTAGGIITLSEIGALATAGVIILSMLGVNVSALLLPAGIAIAVAAKDMTQNFLAGFFLFVVQPFKLGDRVTVTMSSPVSSSSSATSSLMGNGMIMGPGGSWFEGVCEKVDLRYTILRQGKRRLVVPNSSFLLREFMISDDAPVGGGGTGTGQGGSYNHNYSSAPPYGIYQQEQPQERRQQEYTQVPPPPPGMTHAQVHQIFTSDNRHVWQYVEAPPMMPQQQVQQQHSNISNGQQQAAPSMQDGLPISVPANTTTPTNMTTTNGKKLSHQPHNQPLPPISTSSVVPMYDSTSPQQQQQQQTKTTTNGPVNNLASTARMGYYVRGPILTTQQQQQQPTQMYYSNPPNHGFQLKSHPLTNLPPDHGGQ
jgi:small-conductance mechanosensitive channel